MRVACLGGGPAGLYFAISMKLRDLSHEVVLFEHNRADDTFGWGVVPSDEALGNLAANDPISAAAIRENFAYWDDVAVEFKGTRTVSSGDGFCGIGRKKLLMLLQDRARALGVELRFQTEAGDDDIERLSRDYDLMVASDGLDSRTRAKYAEHFKPDVDVRRCKFLWLGTRQKFDDAFTFIFKQTEHGWVWAHAYQFDADTATFIVECSEATWTTFGFGEMSKETSIATCERIFAEELGGHGLISNAHHIRGSAWISFPRVLCETWGHGNVVLIGDAAATAHFSIGSGTRLALDSAIALANYLHSEPDMAAAFAKYQDERRLDVLRLQSAARNSMEWFEEVERYFHLDPVRFTYSLLTRSQRISHENLRLRDADWLEGAERWFQRRANGGSNAPARRPMFAPFRLREMELKNRIVVSPMAQYKAFDGCPTDWHLVHLGERAKGGAGLVYTEMTCVTPECRISPGCPGTYAPEHEAAWKPIVDFVHAETEAKICLQLGHSGAKGSTALGWVEDNRPLESGNWPILSDSDVPWSPQNQVPKAMDRADMDRIRDAFVAATGTAERAGFDMLELHMAHGYLLSSFITSLTNTRTDEYGGSLENRMRYPLEIFRAVRAAWPDAKPISVRISASDWVGDDGVKPEDAVEIARMVQAAGVDICDVSAGQTSTWAKPVYGRMFPTPFSDRIRNETGMATMAVGNIYEPDHVNSILMAGRADLVALARPHLAEVAGGEMRIVTGDVTKPEEVRAMFEQASHGWGAPAIVVANAGGAASRPFLETTPADFAAMVELNLGGAFATWHAGLAPMLDAGWGRPIAVASTAGLKGYPYVAGYCAAKHGVVGLTRAVALETARSDVTVNAVCPGYMLTPMLERSIETIMAKTGGPRAEVEARLLAANPQRRFIAVEEVAAAILWLSSNGAASVTGQALSISGGEA